jgi:molybdopterin-containing oxidoreductase family iron-sulfur binding subunit
MNRLYAVESTYSVTGGMADHRFRLPGRHIGPFAVALAQELKALGLNLNIDTQAAYPEGIFDKKWINVVARDLLSAGKSSLIIAGRRQPSYVHALIMAINDALGAIGNTVTYRKAADAAVPSTDDLAALVEKMNRGNISTLIILEGNPVYNAPSDLKFAEALKKVEHTIHLSLYNDETSQAVEWHIPETHYLESWGDARAVKGTSSVIQPMIEPLYGGHSYLEMLNLIATGRDQRGYDLIRERWKGYMGTPSFDKHWKEILCDGVLTSAALPLRATMIDDINLNRTTASTGPGNESIDYDNPEVVFASAALLSDRQAADNGRRKESNDSMIMNEHQAVTYYPEVIKINYDYLNKAINSSLPTYRAIDSNNLEVIFASSPHLFDGRFANNGWLQELPDAVTKITWDNPALISPRTAKELNLENGDMVRLDYQGHSLEMPVWIVPGQADYSVILILGYGRKAAGKVGDNVGFDTYKLRTSDAKDFGEGLEIIKTGQTYKLAVTQEHQSMEGRPLVREATLDEYRRQPDFAPQMVKHAAIESIFTEHKYDRGYQWGMAIDLNACIGCNACTIACQSENNIPIVGKEQVARGREMHWIRNDRYFVGDIDSPEMVHQPVACQHCENAPCETVCPVAATVHDREGLNVMTYNRCIGTRYCSNNCPYKVRRFNFFNYTNKLSETIKMAQNPEVTVRSRGVMEKCTFCVQRISHAKARAKLEGREVRVGELVTACQQTCPSRAIVFGNINDPDSEIARIKKQNRNYQILAEFNTRPRNSYLARIRNPHPELENYKPVIG